MSRIILVLALAFGVVTIGFVNWSPRSHVDPQPYIEAGYYTEHHKFIVGGIHADYKNEVILGYAYDFNKQWRVQVDFQSGKENSSTIGFTWNITPDFQMNPALYVTNDKSHELIDYVVFTYTLHLWAKDKKGKGPERSGRLTALCGAINGEEPTNEHL